MSEWTVRMTVPGLAIYTGTRSLLIDPDADPVLPQLTSVKWSHELDDSDEAWPRREAMTTATVQLLMTEAADAAWIGPQSIVLLELLTETGGDVVDSFSGRPSYPTIVPHELGVLVTVTVTDYLLDLQGFMVGGVPLPAELASDRINDLMGGSLIVPEPWWAVLLAARPANAVSLLDFMMEVVYGTMAEKTVLHIGVQYAAYELRPRLDGGYLHPTNPWHLVALDKRTYANPPPLRLREHPDHPGTYEAYADPADPAVIDADATTFGAEWRKRLETSVNTVHVKLADGTHVTATNAVPGTDQLIAYTRETQLDPSEADNALELATFLLPERGNTPPQEWQADEFTVLLNETPDGWYPLELRRVMALGGLQRRHHPQQLTYMHGIVTKRELDVAGGVATVTLRLEVQPIFSPGPPEGITVDELPGTVDSLSWVTIDELGLVHS